MVEGLNVIPWLAVVSNDGEVLATSVSDEGNIAFPLTEPAQEHFAEMLRRTSKRLSTTEIKVIIAAMEPQE